MKRLFLFIIILSLSFSLLSCSPSPPFERLSSALRCELSWRFGGEEFRASASATAADGTPRDFSLCFTSPPSVSGLRAERINGNAILYINDLRVGSAPSLYTDIADSLLSPVSFKYLCTTETGGASALCYASGNDCWYFSKDDGRPIRVECDGFAIDILWIEFS